MKFIFSLIKKIFLVWVVLFGLSLNSFAQNDFDIVNSYEYKNYSAGLRSKILEVFKFTIAHTLINEKGIVEIKFRLSKDGKLMESEVNYNTTTAPGVVVDYVKRAIKMCSPFQPFPDVLAKKYNDHLFYIKIDIKRNITFQENENVSDANGR